MSHSRRVTRSAIAAVTGLALAVAAAGSSLRPCAVPDRVGSTEPLEPGVGLATPAPQRAEIPTFTRVQVPAYDRPEPRLAGTKPDPERTNAVELPNGLILRPRTAAGPPPHRTDGMTYEIAEVSPGADWEAAGLRPGDAIVAVEGTPPGNLTLQELIDLTSDPDARLLLSVNDGEGVTISAEISLNDALEVGIPGLGQYRIEDYLGDGT